MLHAPRNARLTMRRTRPMREIQFASWSAALSVKISAGVLIQSSREPNKVKELIV
jgi:hypothetical protein